MVTNFSLYSWQPLSQDWGDKDTPKTDSVLAHMFALALQHSITHPRHMKTQAVKSYLVQPISAMFNANINAH
jgi:hypothetical protein